jgi:hypothetical protein
LLHPVGPKIPVSRGKCARRRFDERPRADPWLRMLPSALARLSTCWKRISNALSAIDLVHWDKLEFASGSVCNDRDAGDCVGY